MQTGVAVGIGGTIVRTTDGGSTWAEQNNGTGNDLYGISFGSTSTAIAIGSSATVIKTTNGGVKLIAMEIRR